MKKLIISIGVPLLLCSTALWAQEKISSTWTLQDCFEYARDHSITLQQNRLSVEESEVNTKEAKAQLFPSFDFSTSHNYRQKRLYGNLRNRRIMDNFRWETAKHD